MLRFVFVILLSFAVPSRSKSMAIIWSEEILASIRISIPHPPLHARNLFHLSVCMYDAFTAYSPNGTGYVVQTKFAHQTPEAAQNISIAYAAFTFLKTRYSGTTPSGSASTFIPASAASSIAANLKSLMQQLGYASNYTVEDATGSNPAGFGVYVANQVLNRFLSDGSLEVIGYVDTTYTPGRHITHTRARTIAID
jgi:hypothetical protein